MPPRTLVLSIAALLLVTVAPELGSESVTLTTYYPAPSGVYTQMITTGNTYLATQSGNVGIGLTNPTSKLTVTGASALNGTLTVTGAAITGTYGLLPSYAAWAAYGTGGGGAAIYNDNGSYKALMLVGNNSAGGNRQVSVWDNFAVNGNVNVTGWNTGPRGYVYISNAVTGCTGPWYRDFGVAGGGGICAVGGSEYATFTPGFYVEGWSYQGHGGQVTAVRGTGTMVGTKTFQVLTLTPGAQFLPGPLQDVAWGTLNTPGSGFYYLCCPK